MSGLRLVIQPSEGPAFDHECLTGTVTLGRGADSDVIVNDYSVSRRHARIESEGDGWVVEDLGARNGTFLDGTRISGRHALRNGSVITMGGTVVRVHEFHAGQLQQVAQWQADVFAKRSVEVDGCAVRVPHPERGRNGIRGQ